MGQRPWVMTSLPEDHTRAEWLARKNLLESHGATIIMVTRKDGELLN
jgi:hypothetical protein